MLVILLASTAAWFLTGSVSATATVGAVAAALAVQKFMTGNPQHIGPRR